LTLDTADLIHYSPLKALICHPPLILMIDDVLMRDALHA